MDKLELARKSRKPDTSSYRNGSEKEECMERSMGRYGFCAATTPVGLQPSAWWWGRCSDGWQGQQSGSRAERKAVWRQVRTHQPLLLPYLTLESFRSQWALLYSTSQILSKFLFGQTLIWNLTRILGNRACKLIKMTRGLSITPHFSDPFQSDRFWKFHTLYLHSFTPKFYWPRSDQHFITSIPSNLLFSR